eukprot:gene2347-4560_t
MTFDIIDNLVVKLSNSHPDVRLRAGTNLLFKLNRGLLQQNLVSSLHFLQAFGDAIQLLTKLIDESHNHHLENINSESSRYLHIILNLLSFIVSTESNSHIVSEFVEKLQKILIIEGVHPNTISSIKKTCDNLCKINVRGTEESKSPVITSQRNVERKDYPVKINMKHTNSKSSSILMSSSTKDVPPVIISDTNATYNKGALLTYGWKFPIIILAKRDEKFLFDLEVRLKLKHSSSALLLLDALIDYPSPIFLQKSGVVRAVFEILSTIETSDSSHTTSPSALTRISCLEWLVELMKGCKRACRTLLDGSICSTLPPITCLSGQGPTLANQLAREMYSMRYPISTSSSSTSTAQDTSKKERNSEHGDHEYDGYDHDYDDYNDISKEDSDVTDHLRGFSSDHQSTSTSTSPSYIPPSMKASSNPPLSLSGLAYACVSVCISLFRCRSPELSATALSLCLEALPFILEPALTKESPSPSPSGSPRRSPIDSLIGSGSGSGETIPGVVLQSADHSRLHHLLIQLDQTLNIWEDILLPDSLLSFITDSQDRNSYVVITNNNNNKLPCTSDFDKTCADLALVRFCGEFLFHIPVEAISVCRTAGSGSSNSSLLPELVLPSNICDILTSLCFQESLQVFVGPIVKSHLLTMLREVRPEAVQAHMKMQRTAEAIHAIRNGHTSSNNRNGNTAMADSMDEIELVIDLFENLHSNNDNNDNISHSGVDSDYEKGRYIDLEQRQLLPDLEQSVILAIGSLGSLLLSPSSDVTTAATISITRLSGLLARLICNTPVSVRMSSLQFVTSVLSQEQEQGQERSEEFSLSSSLLEIVTNPIFLHSLLFSAVSTVNIQKSFSKTGSKEVEVEDGDDGSLYNASCSLLEVIMSQQLQIIKDFRTYEENDFSSDVLMKWKMFFIPLQLIEWNRSKPLSPLPHLSSFLEHLKISLVSSVISEGDNDTWIRCLVIGLFHKSNAVRSQSYKGLLVELQRNGFIHHHPHHHQQHTMGDVSAPVDGLPFTVSGSMTGSQVLPLNSIHLSEWKSSQLPPSSSSSSSSSHMERRSKTSFARDATSIRSSGVVGTFSHTDLRRIANIAFSYDVEVSLRGTALRQVVEAVGADSLLLDTAEENWCVKIATQALAMIQGVRKEDDDSELALAAAKLLYVLIGKVVAVRTALCLLPVDDEDSSMKICIAPLLITLLAPRYRISNSIPSLETKRLCAESLWHWVMAEETWALSSIDGNCIDTEIDCVWESVGTENRSLLPVPTFLREHVLSVTRNEPAQDGSDGSEIYLLNITPITARVYSKHKSGHHRSSAVEVRTRRLFRGKDALRDMILSWKENYDPKRTFHSLSMAVSTSIKRANGHKSMRTALSAGRCIALAVHSMGCGWEESDLSDALTRVLETAPITASDHTTFVAALSLLEDVVTAQCTCNSNTTIASQPCLASVVVEAISGPLLCLLDIKERSMTSYKRQSALTNEVVEVTQSAVLSVLAKILISDEQGGGNLIQSISIPLTQQIAKLLSSDSSQESSWIRWQCAKILELLTENDDLREMLKTPIDGSSENTSWMSISTASIDSRSPLENICRCARQLRMPDSFISSSTLIGCLRVLLVTMRKENVPGDHGGHRIEMSTRLLVETWSWVVRLCFDRRGEVRVLAIELLGSVLFGVDIIQEEGEDVEGEEAVECNEMSGDERSDNIVHQWPPLDSLYVIASDTCECTHVRGTAMLILANLLQTERKRNTSTYPITGTDTEHNLVAQRRAQLLGCVSSFLPTCSKHCSVGINLCLYTISTLLLNPCRTMEELNNTTTNNTGYGDGDDMVVTDEERVIRSLKILPMVVDILHPNIIIAMNSSVALKLGEDVMMSSFSSSSSSSRDVLDSNGRGGNVISGAKGWNDIWSAIKSKQQRYIIQTQTEASRFLLSLLLRSRSERPAGSYFIDEMIRKCNLIRNIVLMISTPASTQIMSDDMRKMEIVSFCHSLEMLCLIVEYTSRSTSSSSYNTNNNNINNTTPNDFPSILGTQSPIPMSITNSLVHRLDAVVGALEVQHGNVVGHHERYVNVRYELIFISRSLRLLVAMLSNRSWKECLLSSGTQETVSNVMSHLVQILLRLESLGTSFATQGLLYDPAMTHLTLSLVLQESAAARQSLEIQLTEKDSCGKSVFHNLISEVQSASNKNLTNSMVSAIMDSRSKHSLDAGSGSVGMGRNPSSISKNVSNRSQLTHSPPTAATVATGRPVEKNPDSKQDLSRTVRNSLTLLKKSARSGVTSKHTLGVRSGSRIPQLSARKSSREIELNSSAVNDTIGSPGGVYDDGAVRTNNKWRGKVRAYSWFQPSTTGGGGSERGSSNIPRYAKGSQYGDYPDLKAIWSSLVLLGSFLDSSQQRQDSAIQHGLPAALCQFLRNLCATGSPCMTKGLSDMSTHSAIASHTFNTESHMDVHQCLVATLSTLCALNRGTTGASRDALMATTLGSAAEGTTPTALGNNTDSTGILAIIAPSSLNRKKVSPKVLEAGTGGGPLVQLTSLALTSSSDVSVRWLCASLASALVSGAAAASAVTTTTTTSDSLTSGHKLVALRDTIESTLRSFVTEGNRNMARHQVILGPFIDTLAACMTVAVDGSHRSSSRRKGSYRGGKDDEMMPFPELASFIWERLCITHDRLDAGVALLRALGQFASSNVAAVHDRPSSRRLLANTVDERSLVILIEGIAHPHQRISSTAAAALRCVVYTSEQARATLKRLVANNRYSESVSSMLDEFSL